MKRLFLCTLFACACGPIEPPGTPGALKEGGFVYCEDPAASCFGTSVIPDHIAVGSTFSLQYSASGQPLTTPDPDLLDVGSSDNGGTTNFTALKAGAATVEVRESPTSKLLDFVRLDLEDTDKLTFGLCDKAFNAIDDRFKTFDRESCGLHSKDGSHLVVSQGSSLSPTVCVFPVDADGQELAGRLSFEWTLDGNASAELEVFTSADTRCATIGGLTTGTAFVTVAGANTSSAVDVSVNP